MMRLLVLGFQVLQLLPEIGGGICYLPFQKRLIPSSLSRWKQKLYFAGLLLSLLNSLASRRCVLKAILNRVLMH